MHLAARGLADKWLTGDVKFSHFLSRFKRHTKFAIQHVENPFDGEVNFGQQIECRIPPKGDFVRNLTLKITLSDPTPDYSTSINDRYYPPSVCSHLVEWVDLRIGGQTIQRLTGEYIYMHQQLHNTADDVDQTMYFLNGHGNFLVYRGDNTYFLDLPFYFYRRPSQAIPVCAINKQLVSVVVKLRPLKEMIFMGMPSNVEAHIRNISLDTEFAYVTPEEINFFRTRQIEYLVEQLQVSKFVMKAGHDTKSVMLNFQHPVRELFFVSQSQASVANNVPNDYNTITHAQLKFNDETVFDMKNKYMVWGQALEHHVNAPLIVLQQALDPDTRQTGAFLLKGDFGMYSWALNPERHTPSGQVNMSRITHKLLTLTINPSYADADNDTRVYAVNFNVLAVNGGLAGLKY
jgi:hypothetical protein